jgi:RNA polymerase sigma-70 factor (ECF subfamily)
MSNDLEFRDLIRRVRAGEEAAAFELVRQYEPEIRRAVRIRLNDPHMHRVLDSMDICQSVLANFFTRAAAGQFDLEQPAQLLKLLVTMARHKLVDQARKQQAERRDQRRVVSSGAAHLDGVADSASSPSQIVSGRELLEAMRKQLTAEERHLADQRAQGKDWAEIAAEVNMTPDAVRKKLTRAMDRVTKELGLDSEGED